MEEKNTLLIIDDEADFLFSMRFFFENARFKVITASTPQEGIEKALLKPDLILLDLKMPGMDGFEVCKRLKQNNATKHIPVIMFTSGVETLDKVTAFNLGVVDYIGKHFPLEEILVRVQSVFRKILPENVQEFMEARSNKILELRSVIQKKDIRVLFQSIVVLTTGKPIGYEALVRGPKGTFLENPVDLFNFAESTNMLLELDAVCRSLSVEKAVFLKNDEMLFLNTDPSVINTDYFKKLEFLKNGLVSPEHICIEITERSCVKNFSMFSTNIKDLRSHGVKVAIDDVGEGYSSLNAIAELKPDFIKIDITLVRNIDADSIRFNLVRLITEFAKRTNSRLIAEGVETQEECQALMSLGVEYGQGYLFMRPA